MERSATASEPHVTYYRLTPESDTPPHEISLPISGIGQLGNAALREALTEKVAVEAAEPGRHEHVVANPDDSLMHVVSVPRRSEVQAAD